MNTRKTFDPADFKDMSVGKMKLATAIFMRAAGLYRALDLPPGEVHITGEKILSLPDFLEELGKAYRTERMKKEKELGIVYEYDDRYDEGHA